MKWRVDWRTGLLHRQGKTFDLIFADPPYEMGYVAASLELLEAYRLCRPHTILVFEHSKRECLPASPEERLKMRTHTYGDTALTILTC